MVPTPQEPPKPANLIASIDFDAILNLVKNSKVPAEPAPAPVVPVSSVPQPVIPKSNYVIIGNEKPGNYDSNPPSPPTEVADPPPSSNIDTDLDFDEEQLPKIEFNDAAIKK